MDLVLYKNQKKMKTKLTYVVPQVKVIRVEVEQGFAISYGTGGGAGPEQYTTINAGGDFF